MTEYEKVQHKPELIKKDAEETSEERRKLQPIVKTQKRKKGLIERLVVAMIGPDGIPAVGRYLNHEIVIPAIKDILVNSISSGVQMMVYGNDGGRPSNIPRQYNRPTKNRPYYSSREKSGYRGQASSYGPSDDLPLNGYVKPSRPDAVDTSEFPIEDRNQALEVMASLEKQAYDYGYVSLADFYDLIGVTSGFTDEKWGWYHDDIGDGKVVRSGREYAVLLPNPQRID